MVRRGPKRLDFRWFPPRPASVHSSFFKLFFEGVFFRCFSISGGFGEGFWNQNGPQNRFLGRFFSMFFLSAFWHRFWVVFWRLETWKIAIFLKENNDFYKIDVFEKYMKKTRFWLHFGRPKPRKIYKKACKKICFFLTLNFERFFRDFKDFGSIWGGPGGPKNRSKIKKIVFGTRLEHTSDFSSI